MIGWHDFNFYFWWQFAYSKNAQLNAINTNATHCFGIIVGISTAVKSWLRLVRSNGRPKKLLEGHKRSSIYCHWDSIDMGIYFLQLWGKMVAGPTFIKPDQLDPWVKDQMKITLLSTVPPLQLPNFVSCGRDKPSHMKQNLVTVGTKLWTAERFLVDPWSMDQADLVW